MHRPSPYHEHLPAGALRPFVECIWTRWVPAGCAAQSHRVLPDGCIDIVLNLSDDAQHGERALVVGTMRQPLEVRSGGASRFVGVRFRPGKARLFLDFRAVELTDGDAPLAALWGRGAGELQACVASPRSRAAIVAQLERALLERLPHRTGERRVDQAVATILHSRGTVAVQEVARETGVSRQHLKNCFCDWVGVSPKFFSRVVRFRTLLGGLRRNPGLRWADAAGEFGYYDQAHLIADFRELAGATPEAFLRASSSR